VLSALYGRFEQYTDETKQNFEDLRAMVGDAREELSAGFTELDEQMNLHQNYRLQLQMGKRSAVDFFMIPPAAVNSVSSLCC